MRPLVASPTRFELIKQRLFACILHQAVKKNPPMCTL